MSNASIMEEAAIERGVAYPPKSRRSSGTISIEDRDEDLSGMTEGTIKTSDGDINASSLPPVDTGYAWIFLACAFTAE